MNKIELRSLVVLLFFLANLSCKKDETSSTETLFEVSIQSSGGGTVDNEGGSFSPGTVITLNAVAQEGFYFDSWTGLGQASDENPLSITVEEDLNITAIFNALPNLTEEVTVYNPKKIDGDPVFMIENGGTLAYLVDKTGQQLYSWEFDLNLGNELKLLSDGTVMGLFKPENTFFSFGGYGGVLRRYDFEGTLIWEYELNTENYLLHHDFTILPNGNILVLVWERIEKDEANALGIEAINDIFTEKIIEIQPETSTIVWEWRSWEHRVQDKNENAPYYGVASENIQKIDLSYDLRENGDIMHANGIAYDERNDLIFMSVNFYSEVWVIDHSLTTEELMGQAGDLVYRFGNPEPYGGVGERLFFNNHHPNFVTTHEETKNHFLVYMNGSENEQSVVYELVIPYESFLDGVSEWVSPTVFASFTDTELFFGRISGAVRLQNGNTLICEGDFGYWEMTPDGEVVWKYDGGGKNFWRGYSFPSQETSIFTP